MRTTIGYMLLGLLIPYAVYAYFHPHASHGMGIVALAVGGGIFLRRGRNDRMRRIEVLPDPTPSAKPAVETPIPPAPKVPSIEPPAHAEPAEHGEGSWHEGDVIIPPAPDKNALRPVLKLVWTDGKRTDVRDFRRKAAK